MFSNKVSIEVDWLLCMLTFCHCLWLVDTCPEIPESFNRSL